MDRLFIINPKSGFRHPLRQLEDHIYSVFNETGNDKFEIVHSEYAGHAYNLARDAAGRGVSMVVAAGGDGTMNEVCSALVNTQTAFGLIPMGSGNGYARSLKIPLNYKAAIQHIKDGKAGKIDVGRIDNRYFFGTAGFTLDAHISAKFDSFNHRGPLPYFYIGLREFLNYTCEDFELEFNGNRINVCPIILTVANTSQYGNGAIIAPQADFADGLLDICIIENQSVLDLSFRLNLLFNGKIQSMRGYKSYRTGKLKIKRSKGSGFYHLDGESFTGGHSHEIEIIPKALTVCR
jgi:diacylglycerol kinase (ATP)